MFLWLMQGMKVSIDASSNMWYLVLIIQVDQLREFHKQHYNPTNGHFYTYGDMPLATHLQRINEEFLCNFERVPQTDSVAKELKWDKPVS
jgi:Zn-dependent M16 (insulinase) family peptidase